MAGTGCPGEPRLHVPAQVLVLPVLPPPPAWFTVKLKVWPLPASVMVPWRELPVLASAVYETGPLPVPEAPLTTCSQDEAALAVQVQVAALAFMVKAPLPPVAAAEAALKERL